MATLWDFLTEQINKHGQGTLADKLGIDASILSKFRSGEGAIKLGPLEALLKLGEAGVRSEAEIKKLEDAFEIATDLWKAAKNHNQVEKK